MTEASASASAPEARNSIAIVAILSAIAFVCYMDRQLIAVLAQPIKHELGLSDSEIGFISGLAFAIFYAGLGIPLARLADRWSRAAVLSLAVAFWTMCNMASGLAASFSQLLFARIGVASGEAACVPASHAIIGERVPAKHRTFAISVFHTCGAAGIMFVEIRRDIASGGCRAR